MTPSPTGTKPHLPAGGCGVTGAEVTGERRRAAFAIAYRMLGSVTDAEDVVQEALLRYQRAAGKETIDSPIAFTKTVATRLAIDALRSAHARRESYIGLWLPEPLLTDEGPGVAEQAETADSLSLAFLVLLETLSPVERAVFLLHDVFGYGYGEIAAIVGKSQGNCRQLAVRARRRVDEKRPRFEASKLQRDRLAMAFFTACEAGEMQGLIGLLADDVAMSGDGGKKPARGPPKSGGPVSIRPRQAGCRVRRRAARPVLGRSGRIGSASFCPEVLARLPDADLTGQLPGLATASGSSATRLGYERVGCLGPINQEMVPIERIVGTSSRRCALTAVSGPLTGGRAAQG
jgi:RNA polymerase sigma factor (sigma-70 family)